MAHRLDVLRQSLDLLDDDVAHGVLLAQAEVAEGADHELALLSPLAALGGSHGDDFSLKGTNLLVLSSKREKRKNEIFSSVTVQDVPHLSVRSQLWGIE